MRQARGRVLEHAVGKRWYCLNRNFLTVHGTRLLYVFTHPYTHAYTHAYTHVEMSIDSLSRPELSNTARHTPAVCLHTWLYTCPHTCPYTCLYMSIDPDVQADAVLVHRHRDTRNDQRMYPGHAAEA